MKSDLESGTAGEIRLTAVFDNSKEASSRENADVERSCRDSSPPCGKKSNKTKKGSCSETKQGSIETTEDLFKVCGDSGRWQLKIFFLAFLAGLPAALQDFLYIFIAATPEEYWCKVPECPEYSYGELKNWSIPVDPSKEGSFSSCSRHMLDSSGSSGSGSSEVSFLCNGIPLTFDQNRTESCKEFDFDHSVFSTTIVTEWNLVCGEEFWASSSQAVYALGSLTGSLIFGIAADSYGRKKAVIISLLISIIFGPIVALAPSYSWFLLARYFLAIGSPGIFDVTYILTIEMMGGKWRGVAGNIFGIPYALGYSCTAVVAYFFRDWRELQLVLTIPPVLFLCIMYFVPESPRWLISKGRVQEAETILRDIATTNGRTQDLPPDFSKIVEEMSRVNSTRNEEELSWQQSFFQFFKTFSSLFRTPKMRRRTIILNICWLSTVLVYFGVALNGHNLSANQYLYTMSSGLLEIPSYLIAAPLIKYFGRKYVFASLLFICGSSLGLSVLFEPGSTAIIALAFIGMFHIASSYALIFLYGIELMPTSLRTYGIGSAAITGKLGNAAAPYISGLMGQVNRKMPTMIFSAVSFLAAFLALLLPETKNKRLPETVEDVENSD